MSAGEEIRITSRNGMDITGRTGDRPIHVRGIPADKPGMSVMLAGQISWNPSEETQNGTIVFDGAACVACHEHGTVLSGFLPDSWDHLDGQLWDHPARLAGGSPVASSDHLVSVVGVEVNGPWDIGRSA